MKFLSPVKHNGTRYEAGQSVPEKEFEKVQLQALLDAGVVSEGKAKETAEDETEEVETNEETAKLKKMNKTQLLALAEERGVEVEDTMTNAELVEKLS